MAQANAIEHGWRPWAPWLGAVLFSAGCATLEPFPGAAAGRELVDVPFFAQTQHQCGPAALATVLSHSGLAVVPDDLSAAVYLPARAGSLQVELVAAARRFGRVPYVLDGRLAALVAEIDAGRPVLVLQNLGVSWYPRWHYAVVVGYDRGRDALVLRSGVTERYVVERARFLRTWRRSESWAMVALAPGELPAQPNPERYFAALAAIESLGGGALAEPGYLAMLQRWPDNADALFGLGNVRFAAGQLAQARTLFQAALDASDGEHVGAANNLAMVWLQSGCARRAYEVASDALAHLKAGHAASPLATIVAETRDEARAALASLDLAEDICDADDFEDD
jgi:tetratricopeptide (TPR) repeat protein